MIMTEANEALFKSAVSNLPAPIQTGLQNASVRLSGKTSGGQTFTGSAVILYSDGTDVVLATAKHNLYVFAGQFDPPAWSDDLVNSFRANVNVVYDNSMSFGTMPTRTAALSGAFPVDAGGQPRSNYNQARWLYDVMILKSNDQNLMQFAANNHVVDNPIDGADRGFVQKPGDYLRRGNQTVFIQTGYGNVRDTVGDVKKITLPQPVNKAGSAKDGSLQYRTTLPSGTAPVTVFNQKETNKQQYTQFDQAIQLTADPTSSTAPGDSGGPLFVATYVRNAWRLYLIGITTGSDMAVAEEPCPKPPALVANNVATSLQYCYQQDLIGGG